MTTQNWLDIATIPREKAVPVPLPGTREFGRTKGREGDWVVVQVGSSIGETAKRRASLRTLGLSGPGSSSLRSSADRGTTGNISKVRDLVAVVDLGGIYYKSASYSSEYSDLEFDRTEYGTDSQPGQLIRDTVGRFYLYESDSRGTLVSWSTELSALEALAKFSEACPVDDDDVGYLAQDSSGQELKLPGPELWDAVSSRDRIAFYQIVNSTMEFAWSTPFKRFHDRDAVYAEVTLYSSQLDVDFARGLARSTGDAEFFRNAGCNVSVKSRGTTRYYTF